MRKKYFIPMVLILAFTLLIGTSDVSARVTSYAKWASSNKTLTVSSNSYGAWTTGANKWKNSTNFKVSVVGGIRSNYHANDVYNSGAAWDGLATTTVSGGIISRSQIQFNTYFTSRPQYTAAIKAGLTGHEIGHSLGLKHVSVVETSSIMHPYTLNSSGTTARSLNPSSSDKSVVNALYLYSKALSNSETSSLTSSNQVDYVEDGVYLSPSWAVYYKDAEELEEEADIIVRGTVEKAKGNKYNKGRPETYATQSTLNITEVIKGNIEEDRIKIYQMGGNDGTTKVVGEHTTLLNRHDEIVIFLKETEEGDFIPINEDDSIFIYTNGGGKLKNIRSLDSLELSVLRSGL